MSIFIEKRKTKNSDTSQESTMWILEKVAIFIEKSKEDRRSSFDLCDMISVKLHLHCKMEFNSNFYRLPLTTANHR
jgi:hypothetical protein